MSIIKIIFLLRTKRVLNSMLSFHKAYSALQNMLEGKDSLNYKKAVFIKK